jgi:hypothetical protein
VLTNDNGPLGTTAAHHTPTGTAQPTASGGPAPSTPSPSSDTATPAGLAWDGARVMSMTATSTRTLVVLGSTGDTGCSGCLRLAESHDGGTSFDPLPLPADLVPGSSTDGASDGNVVSDVRFGSANDGWLFGGALRSTHDGGHTWGYVQLPATVRALEAANGRVWALVGANKTGGDLVNDQLWSSPVGSDKWKPVPGVVVTAPGAIAVQGAQVTVLGADRSPGWSNAGGSFTKVQNPCRGTLEPRLTGSGSLWATCVTGTAAFLSTSDDGGTSWATVPVSTGQGALPNSVAVGARSTGEAVIGIPQQPLVRLASNGKTSAVVSPPSGGDGGYSYLGFTNRDVGYAILVGDTSLWRSDDGAATWRALKP